MESGLFLLICWGSFCGVGVGRHTAGKERPAMEVPSGVKQDVLRVGGLSPGVIATAKVTRAGCIPCCIAAIVFFLTQAKFACGPNQ